MIGFSRFSCLAIPALAIAAGGADAAHATKNMNCAPMSANFLYTAEKVLNYASKLSMSFSPESSMAFPAVFFLLAFLWSMMQKRRQHNARTGLHLRDCGHGCEERDRRG